MPASGTLLKVPATNSALSNARGAAFTAFHHVSGGRSRSLRSVVGRHRSHLTSPPSRDEGEEGGKGGEAGGDKRQFPPASYPSHMTTRRPAGHPQLLERNGVASRRRVRRVIPGSLTVARRRCGRQARHSRARDEPFRQIDAPDGTCRFPNTEWHRSAKVSFSFVDRRGLCWLPIGRLRLWGSGVYIAAA